MARDGLTHAARLWAEFDPDAADRCTALAGAPAPVVRPSLAEVWFAQHLSGRP